MSATPVDRLRQRNADLPALFSYGFRPFFLGGAITAALAVPLWLAHGAWRRGAAHQPDRRAHHAELHPQLAGQGRAVAAAQAVRPWPDLTAVPGRLRA